MPQAATSSDHAPNMFLDFMEAIANRHGEVDLRMDHVTLRLPILRDSIELNGSVSISVHLRELTAEERAAHAARQVRALEA